LNQKIYSQRAQNLIEHPVGLKTDLPFGFNVTLDANDKILTLNYGRVEKVEARVPLALFYEVFVGLGIKKNLASLSLLNFREAENFLRDENSIPSFSLESTEITAVEELFIEAQMNLLSTLAIALLKKEALSKEIFSPVWEQKSLVEKNQVTVLLSQKLNIFLPPEKKWEVLLAEADSLSIKTASSQWSSALYEKFLQPIWNEFTGAQDIKVVAV
jgi:hypothetical protein